MTELRIRKNKLLIVGLAVIILLLSAIAISACKDLPSDVADTPPKEEPPVAVDTYSIVFPVLEKLAFISDSDTVLKGADFSFSVRDTYLSTAPFSLSANGQPLTATNGVYTVKNVVEDIVIAFDGAYDDTFVLSADSDLELASIHFSAQSVKYGQSTAFSVVLDDEVNHSTISVSVNGQALTANADGTYALNNVTESQVVSVENVTLNTYSVIYVAQDGGSLVGENSQIITHGSSTSEVSAIPDPHNVFVQWSDGNTSATRSDIALTDSNIYAVFEKEKVDISWSDDRFSVVQIVESGELPCVGGCQVVYASDFSFRIDLAKNYSQSLYEVKCDGESLLGTEGRYTIEAVTSDKTITVENLAINKYNVSFADIDGIEFLYEVGQNVDVVCGESFAFTTRLFDQYSDSDVKLLANGAEIAPVEGVYSVAVTQNTMISAVGITLNKCKVTFETDGGRGNVVDQYFVAGEYMTSFPKSVKDDYRFDGWLMGGETVDTSVPYLINSDVTFTAEYSLATPCIAYSDTIHYISDCDENGNVIIADSIDGLLITRLFLSPESGKYFTPTRLVMNNYVTEVYGGAREDCFTNLEQIVFSPTLEKIGDWAFATTKITELDLPTTLTEIGLYAFAWCGNLRQATCLGLTTLGGGAFAFCNSLEGFYAENLEVINESTFVSCGSLTDINLSNIKVIKESAFSSAFSDEANYSLTFNNDVELGDSAFSSARIASVTFLKNAKIGQYALSSTDIEKITLSNASEVGLGAFSFCEDLTEAVVPNLAPELFRSNHSLRSVTVTNKITAFPREVFYVCLALTDLVFPQNSLIETVGSSAFERVGNIAELKFRGDCLTEIGLLAFARSAIERLSITPGTLPLTIGIAAFIESGIKQFLLPSNTVEIKAFAFANVLHPFDFFSNFSLPVGLKTIGTQAFIGSRLSDIFIPNTVTDIAKGGLALLEASNAEVNVYFTGSPPSVFEEQKLIYERSQTAVDGSSREYMVSFAQTVMGDYGEEQVYTYVAHGIQSTSLSGNEHFGLNYYFRVPVEQESAYVTAFADYEERITSGEGNTHSAAFLNNFSEQDQSAFIAAQSTLFVLGGKQILTAPTDLPERDDYVFIGWYKDREGISAFEFGKPLNIDADLVLYAVWEKIPHLVTYVLNGGDNDPSNPSQFYADGNLQLAEATKQGFRFYGWYKDEQCTEQIYVLSGTSDLTLYAKYEPNRYNVSFSGMGTNSELIRINHGEKVIKPKDPEVEGYTFVGWTLNGQIFDFDTSITQNISLISSWNRIPISITFDADGGTFGGTVTLTVNGYKGESVSPHTTPTKQGYYFAGWKDEVGNAVAMPITINLTTTLYAEWLPSSYEITLNYGNCTSYFYQKTGEKIGYLPTADKLGYIFLGWFLNDSPVVATDVFDYAENITLTTKYSPITYTVAYNADGGEGVLPQSPNLLYDQSYIIPQCSLTRKGYNFVCWANGSNEYAVGEEVQSLQTHANGTFTLTAKWEERNYTISFNAGEGSGSIEGFTKKAYEDFYLPNANGLTFYGHSFVGWRIGENDYSTGTYLFAESLVNGADTLMFTAIWEAVDCEIELIVNDKHSSIWTKFGDSVSDFGTPNALGQVFEGWFLEQNGEGEEISLPYHVDSIDKKTFYAYMPFIMKTVSFANDGEITAEGDLPESQFIVWMQTAVAPSVSPTAQGYSFRGWVTSNNREYDFSTPVTEDITLYAAWEVAGITLTQICVLENTFTHESNRYNVTLACGRQTLTFGSLDKVYLDEYKLLGYYMDEDKEQAVQFPLTVNEDTEIYAFYRLATEQSVLQRLGATVKLLSDTERVVIPDTSNGRKITEFDANGFAFTSIDYNLYLTSIKNQYGFIGESLTLPADLSSFDAYSAAGCTALREYVKIEGGSSAYSVTDGVLYKGTELISYPVAKSESGEYYNETVTVVGEYALSNTAFTSVNLPNVDNVKEYAFFGSKISEYVGLAELSIGFFGKGAFDMTELLEVELGLFGAKVFYDSIIPDTVQSVVFNGLDTINNSLVGYASNVTELVVQGYTKLYCDFRNYSSLLNVTLSDCEEIGSYAFYYNRATLEQITFANELRSIGAYAFFETDKLNGQLPDSVVDLGEYALYNSKLIKGKALNNAFDYVGNFALVGGVVRDISTDEKLEKLVSYYGEAVHTSLESVTFTGGESGDCRAFTALKTVYVDADNFCFSENAFANTDIEKLHINCTTNLIVGNSAFKNADALSDLRIATQRCLLNGGCFDGCTAFSSLCIVGELSVLGVAPFDNSNVTEVICDFSRNTLMQLMGETNNVTKVIVNGSSIVDNAFSGSAITEITVGENVRTMGGYLFAGCLELGRLVIPTTVNVVADYALFGSRITDIEFSSKHSYYDMCGHDTSKLTRAVVTAAEQESSLKEECFMNATNLLSLTLADEITEYKAYSLYNCSALSNIDFSGKSLGAYAVYGRTLDELTIEKDCVYDDNSLRGVRVNILRLEKALSPYKLFGVYDAVTEIAVGREVSSIPQSTFEGIKTKGITLHDRITEIGARAFAETNITKIYLATTLTSIGERAFYNCVDLAAVTIPERVTNVGEYAFGGCKRLESAVINGQISEISEGTFYECISLATVTIPQSVKIINDYAFYYATKLNGMSLPNGLSRIGAFAFYNCTVMENVTFADSLTYIGEKAFYACASFTDITVSQKVKEIGAFAFAMCIKLEKIVLPDRLEIVGDGVLDNDTQLVWISIPSGLTVRRLFLCDLPVTLTKLTFTAGKFRLADFALKDVLQISEVDIEEGVARIGESAFENCLNLKEIRLPSTLQEIGRYAFKNTLIEQITLPDGLTFIGEGAFENATLKKIVIPNSVTNIESDTFYGCKELQSVTLSSQIFSIGDYAFMRCSKLVEITIPSSVVSIDCWAFAECVELMRVNFASDSKLKAINHYAFKGCGKLNNFIIPSSVIMLGWGVFMDDLSLDNLSIECNEQGESGIKLDSLGYFIFQNSKIKDADDVRLIDYLYTGPYDVSSVIEAYFMREKYE